MPFRLTAALFLAFACLIAAHAEAGSPRPRPDDVVFDGVAFGFDCSDEFITSATGTVFVSGSLGLNVSGQPCPAGREYVLVENDGTEPIVGTFDGIPEGGLILVGGQAFRISYTGGDGNDLTATALGGIPALDGWALALLGAVLAGVAVTVLRR